MEDWPDEIHWNADGLAPAIAQNRETGHVLMMAWINRKALVLTASENRAIYWSRSCDKLWCRGEEPGHMQKLHELRLDYDADVVILMVERVGGIVYHTGRENCFCRILENGARKTVDPMLEDPDAVCEHARYHHD